MSVYSYNSSHKVITVVVIVAGIAFFHFSRKERSKEERFFSNGQVKYVGNKEDQLNHGEWVWYYKNGQKSIEGAFRFGKREGIWTQYDVQGNVSMTSTYKNNQLNGLLTTYATDGSIMMQMEYRADTIYKRLKENL